MISYWGCVAEHDLFDLFPALIKADLESLNNKLLNWIDLIWLSSSNTFILMHSKLKLINIELLHLSVYFVYLIRRIIAG